MVDKSVEELLIRAVHSDNAAKQFFKSNLSDQSLLEKIEDRYNEIIQGLNMELSLKEEFAKIAEHFKNKSGKEYAASRGEYLNGIVLANYLGFEFLDAAKAIFFHEDGTLNVDNF